LPRFLLIGYDLKHMHQILILNFFRFIDQLEAPGLLNHDWIEAPEIRENIYAEIAKLDDAALQAFLLSLGTQMTDTMEFNFYGAYMIDFDALISIKAEYFDEALWKRYDYTITLSKFITALQAGQMEVLTEAHGKIPTLFESYRFIDYLLAKVEHPDVTSALLEMRRAVAPFWETVEDEVLAGETANASGVLHAYNNANVPVSTKGKEEETIVCGSSLRAK